MDGLFNMEMDFKLQRKWDGSWM